MSSRRLVGVLTLITLVLFAVFIYSMYQVFAMSAELAKTKENLVTTSNMYREAVQELGYWQELKPLIQEKLNELRESQQKDPNFSV